MEIGLLFDGEINGITGMELYVNPAYLAINILSPQKKITVPGVQAIEAVEEDLDKDGNIVVSGVKAVEGVEEEFVLEYPCNLNALVHRTRDSEVIGGRGIALSNTFFTQKEMEAVGKIMQDVAARSLEGSVKL